MKALRLAMTAFHAMQDNITSGTILEEAVDLPRN